MSARIGAALGFDGEVHKSGYMWKRAKKSGANWKRRYFVLNDSSLVYLESHKNANAKGNVLITTDLVVRDVVEPKYAHCFEIVTAFETLRVAADTQAHVSEWKESLLLAVSRLEGTTRGFLELKVRSKYLKKFFVVHSNALTYHADHFETHRTQGSIKLGSRTTVSKSDQELTVVTGSQQLVVSCGDDVGTWEDAIKAAIAAAESRDDLAGKVGSESKEDVLIDGYLETSTNSAAHAKTNDTWRRRGVVLCDQSFDVTPWKPKFYALTRSALYQAANENSTEAESVFLISPTCAVFETKFRDHAFELVTSEGVLHVHAKDDAERTAWTDALREAISKSSRLVSDPLVDAARHLELDLYDVHFDTKRPLGIVLERSAEWAIVKSSKKHLADTTPGSALAAVNGASCLLDPYASVISRLTGWVPPLTLTFARPPVLSGWLAKRARGRSGRSGKGNWKQRFFELKEGKLAYFDRDVSEASPHVRNAATKGALLLMGCAVALAPKGPETDDLPFCLRLVSGVGVLVMQGTTLGECLEWATMLYHSIAIANGGGYLLDIERQKRTPPPIPQDCTTPPPIPKECCARPPPIPQESSRPPPIPQESRARPPPIPQERAAPPPIPRKCAVSALRCFDDSRAGFPNATSYSQNPTRTLKP